MLKLFTLMPLEGDLVQSCGGAKTWDKHDKLITVFCTWPTKFHFLFLIFSLSFSHLLYFFWNLCNLFILFFKILNFINIMVHKGSCWMHMWSQLLIWAKFSVKTLFFPFWSANFASKLIASFGCTHIGWNISKMTYY